MEHEYSVQLPKAKSVRHVCPYHEQATVRLQSVPPTWTLEHDEDLAQFLCAHIELHNDMLGSIKNFVESVDVSSTSVSFKNNINISICNRPSVKMGYASHGSHRTWNSGKGVDS